MNVKFWVKFLGSCSGFVAAICLGYWVFVALSFEKPWQLLALALASMKITNYWKEQKREQSSSVSPDAKDQ